MFDLIHVDGGAFHCLAQPAEISWCLISVLVGGHSLQDVVYDVAQVAKLAHALTVVVIDDCTSSLDCTSAPYACNSHFCVCNAVAQLVRATIPGTPESCIA